MCKRMTIAAVAAVVLACVSGVQAQVVIETVTVGKRWHYWWAYWWKRSPRTHSRVCSHASADSHARHGRQYRKSLSDRR